MAKFCTVCGNRLARETSRFCDKCGTPIPFSPSAQRGAYPISPESQQPEYSPANAKPDQKVPFSGKWSKLWIALGCGVIILIIVIIISFSGMHQSATTGSSPFELTPTLSVSDFKSQSRSIPWADLMNNPDHYKGSIVYFRGEILQVLKQEDDTTIVRLSTKRDPSLSYTADDVVYINYNGHDGLSENSIADLWGNFVGSKKYTTISGDEITVPEINSLHMETVTSTT